MSGEHQPIRRPYHTLRCVLGPLIAPVYGAVVAGRNRRFDRGVGVRRVPVPVISVGNLTVGGTGKTPFVMWLCGQLAARGVKPAIAMRGYKSETSGGRSDEAEEYRRALPGVPVIVNPDRHAGITSFLAGGGKADVVLLDDGFQHRQLHRDLDIVLIDARSKCQADHLLPWGDLREPFRGSDRADVLVYTHAQADPLPATGEGQLVVASQHTWSGLTVHTGGNDSTLPVDWLRGRRVVVVCGIGRPERFVEACQQAGCVIVGGFYLPDHQRLDPATLADAVSKAAESQADAIITTHKDIARHGGVPTEWSKITVVRPDIGLTVSPAGPLIDRAVAVVARGGINA